MVKYFALSLLLLGSCQSQLGTNILLEKQTQAITKLRKELTKAEEDLDLAASNLAQIQTQLHIAELGKIRSKIRIFQNKVRSFEGSEEKYNQYIIKNASSLFARERELLNVMITNSFDEEFSFEAQKVLDQILNLISEMDEQYKAL